jgi:hypothetical protein
LSTTGTEELYIPLEYESDDVLATDASSATEDFTLQYEMGRVSDQEWVTSQNNMAVIRGRLNRHFGGEPHLHPNVTKAIIGYLRYNSPSKLNRKWANWHSYAKNGLLQKERATGHRISKNALPLLNRAEREQRRAPTFWLPEMSDSDLADVESAVDLSDAPSEWELGPDSDARAELEKARPKLARMLGQQIRFCMFNVGNLTKREFWGIIKDNLTVEILTGITRVESVLQPNGRKRMDLWVRTAVASSLKSALHLRSDQRKRGGRDSRPKNEEVAPRCLQNLEGQTARNTSPGTNPNRGAISKRDCDLQR